MPDVWIISTRGRAGSAVREGGPCTDTHTHTYSEWEEGGVNAPPCSTGTCSRAARPRCHPPAPARQHSRAPKTRQPAPGQQKPRARGPRRRCYGARVPACFSSGFGFTKCLTRGVTRRCRGSVDVLMVCVSQRCRCGGGLCLGNGEKADMCVRAFPSRLRSLDGFFYFFIR